MTLSQIVLGLLTLMMSGVVAAYVTHKLNADRDYRRFRLQKLEETFMAFKAYLRTLDGNWLPYISVMTGKLDYNQCLDMIIKGGERICHFDRLEMSITLYWPELLPFLRRLIDLREKANDVLHDHKRRYEEGHIQDKISYDAMKPLITELTALEKEFSDAANRAALVLSAGWRARWRRL